MKERLQRESRRCRLLLESVPARSIKEAWVQVPQYRKAMICAILGLIFVLFGVILSLSY